MSYESDREIYLLLIEGGLTPAGAAGSMGNMYAESTMKSNIAQRGMTNLSDEAYTAAVDTHDHGAEYAFIHDAVGYGLCQWTYYSRKAALLEFAKSKGVSIGDTKMQVEFYLHELQSYPGVLYVLTTSDDVKQCSDIVCTEFERPAVNNLDARYRYSMEFYEKFNGTSIPGLTGPSNEPAYQPNCQPSYQPAYQDSVNDAPTQKVVHDQLSFGNLITNLASKITGKKSFNSSQMPVLKEGDQGAGVAAIQVALKYHKIDIGDTGTLGIWEAGTTKGIKAFQGQNDLTVTGIMDGPTWSKLMQ